MNFTKPMKWHQWLLFIFPTALAVAFVSFGPRSPAQNSLFGGQFNRVLSAYLDWRIQGLGLLVTASLIVAWLMTCWQEVATARATAFCALAFTIVAINLVLAFPICLLINP